VIGETMAGTGHDLEEARTIGSLLCRSLGSVDSYMEFARIEAAGLIADNARAVRAVAAALVEYRTLTGGEISRIIRTPFRD